MPSFSIINSLLKLLIVFSMLWGVINLYLALYWRVIAIKKKELLAESKARMKDFSESLVFMFFFWVYIVVQVYMYGIGVFDDSLKTGENSVCIGFRVESYCLGRQEKLFIEHSQNPLIKL